MRQSPPSPTDRVTLISFDGGIAKPVMRQRPDRYRLLGAAVCSGLAACHYEYICLTDGDDQYEIADFAKLLKLQRYYDLILTFRYKKIYSSTRMFVDVSTGLRIVRRSILSNIQLEARSLFIGAELAIKGTLRGYRVGEVGIQTFPRTFGRGSSTSPKNILATMVEHVAHLSEHPLRRIRAACWAKTNVTHH